MCTTPRGVSIASATQSGMLCVTRRNSIVNEPIRDPLARLHAHLSRFALSVVAVLVELGLDQRQRERRAVDRPVHVRQHVRHRADVVLVPVRQHERRDR